MDETIYEDEGVQIIVNMPERSRGFGSRGFVYVAVESPNGRKIGFSEPLSRFEEHPCHNSINIGVNICNKMAWFTGVSLEVTE